MESVEVGSSEFRSSMFTIPSGFGRERPLVSCFLHGHNLLARRCMHVSWVQVNTALTDLATAPNDNRRRHVLNRIRSECSPMNQKWIVRVSQDTRRHETGETSISL